MGILPKRGRYDPIVLDSPKTHMEQLLRHAEFDRHDFCASYFLSVYFQAVKGASPLLSGVYLLPSILSQLILAVVAGLDSGGN